jgi:hypothetical protein
MRVEFWQLHGVEGAAGDKVEPNTLKPVRHELVLE